MSAAAAFSDVRGRVTYHGDHTDPVDRVIVATALIKELPLLTKDSLMRAFSRREVRLVTTRRVSSGHLDEVPRGSETAKPVSASSVGRRRIACRTSSLAERIDTDSGVRAARASVIHNYSCSRADDEVACAKAHGVGRE